MTAERRVEHHLGTAITVCAESPGPGLFDDVFGCIARYEAVLSRFRPGSELARLATGAMGCDEVSPAVREVLTGCERLRLLTRGDFEHEPRGRAGDLADPVLDTDGFAKGWIVEQACLVLRMAGVRSFFVNAGGDVVAGGPPPGRDAWRVGIRDPFDPTSVRLTLQLDGAALATSGAYERGAHIRRHGSDPLASVTVIGPDLAVADALATAVFAAGAVTPDWWQHDGDYDIVAIDRTGRLRWTRSAERYELRFATAA